MSEVKGRWLTLEEICEELRLPPMSVWNLVHRHKIVGLKGSTHNRSNATTWRFLDPSEEYKKALNAQESILRNSHTIDLMRFPIIGMAEFAELAGVPQSTLRNYVQTGALKPYRIGRHSVFTADQVRAFMLARERKEPRERRARCEDLIRWCRRKLDANPQATMTREEVQKDNAIEGQLRKIMRQREPERSRNLAEFWRRFDLIKSAARVTKRSQVQNLD